MKKKLILGLIGSGKITLYRHLNEQKISYAVETQFKCGILKQERLFNIRWFLRDATIDEIPQEIKHLYKYCPHSRMQVGQDKTASRNIMTMKILNIILEKNICLKRGGDNNEF